MSEVTPLAEALISRSNHDIITIELIEPADLPPKIKVSWPLQPSLIDPTAFPDFAAVSPDYSHGLTSSLRA
jgi:hypothetical protein